MKVRSPPPRAKSPRGRKPGSGKRDPNKLTNAEELATIDGQFLRRQQFVREYLFDHNGAAAARRAGFKSSAAPMATVLLKDPWVKSEIKRLTKIQLERYEVTRDRVVAELARIAFSDLRDVVEWDGTGVRLKGSDEIREDFARALVEVSETPTKFGPQRRVKMHDKLAALTVLAKHLKMFDLETKGATGEVTIKLSIEDDLPKTNTDQETPPAEPTPESV